jgi:hypothetical protein
MISVLLCNGLKNRYNDTSRCNDSPSRCNDFIDQDLEIPKFNIQCLSFLNRYNGLSQK